MDPLALPLPGGPELLSIGIVLLIPASVAYWVYQNAKARGSEYAANWGLSMFLFGVLGFFPIFVGLGLYTTVRDEFEP